MQQVNPTILSTPLSIYQSLQATFANPNVNLDWRGQNIILHINFSPQIPTLSLTNAVDAKLFQETIQKIKMHLDTLRLFGASLSPIQLDSSRFSYPLPLSNWQEYQRFRLNTSGGNCIDTLLRFLQNPTVIDPVNQIGLSPQQIDGQATPVELVYFRELLEKIRTLNQEPKQAMLRAFEQLYPNIFQQLLSEKVAETRRVEGQSADNFYQSTITLLKQQVIGQDQAVEKISTVLATQRNMDSNKVFLFVGPSGVGKTELAKAVSRSRENRFIMLQMQTYQEEHSASKIFGSPHGYVGSTDKPSFAKELDKFQPILVSNEESTQTYHISNLVILFDEFEKAHSKIKQSLLTLFDEGLYVAQYTEGNRNKTCRYLLKKCIIANTSNLYKHEILKAFSSGYSSDQIIELFKQLNRDLPNLESLSTELIGRMSIVPFGPIPRGEPYQKVARLQLNDFCNKLIQEFRCKLVDVEQEAMVLSALETKLYGDGTDIRRFEGYFYSVKNTIYQNFQNWGNMENKKLTFCIREGTLCIKVSIYIEDFLRYHDLGVPILRLP